MAHYVKALDAKPDDPDGKRERTNSAHCPLTSTRAVACAATYMHTKQNVIKNFLKRGRRIRNPRLFLDT